MSSLVIRRLHLAAGRDRHWAARLAVERALADCPLGQGRLLLVRRGPSLHLPTQHGRQARQPQRVAAVQSQFLGAMEPLAARAVHGAKPGAGQAEAVWFRDRGDALACYIALLAAGRRPHDWYWHMALPADLPVRSAPAMLDILANRLLGGGEQSVATAAILTRAFRLAPPITIMRMLAARGGNLVADDAAPEQLASLPPAAPPATIQEVSYRPAETLQLLEQALTQHSTLRAVLVESSPADTATLAPITLALLLAHHRPDLAASPSTHRAILAVWRNAVRTGSLPFILQTAASVHQTAEPLQASVAETHNILANRELSPEQTQNKLSGHDKQTAHTPDAAHPETDQATPSADPDMIGATFPGAGLLLTIPSLIRLGFPEWLAEHPDLLQRNVARGLLLALFARYAPRGLRSAAMVLTGTPRLPIGPPSPEEHHAIELWRHSLDGWLRRLADCRLHDLAKHDGHWHEETERHFIAYPLSAIHMGLRRRALDVDPGWTAWLGISLRYVFSERYGDRADLA